MTWQPTHMHTPTGRHCTIISPDRGDGSVLCNFGPIANPYPYVDARDLVPLDILARKEDATSSLPCGTFQVCTKRLTDGSLVYDVSFVTDDGDTCLVASPVSKAIAEFIARALNDALFGPTK
jgi:hypothetical protein